METLYQSKIINTGDRWFENASKLKYQPQHYKYQVHDKIKIVINPPSVC